MKGTPEYVLSRKFNAPRPLVWQAWTRPELLSRWYGPNVETVIHRLEVRPGGLWLNEMKMGDNSSYQRTEFVEVAEPERLVCLMSNANSAWDVEADPRMPDWPRTLLTTVEFREDGGQTAMRLTWVPHEASQAEIECFAAALSGMDKGWAKGMDLLAQLLVELQR